MANILAYVASLLVEQSHLSNVGIGVRKREILSSVKHDDNEVVVVVVVKVRAVRSLLRPADQA